MSSTLLIVQKTGNDGSNTIVTPNWISMPVYVYDGIAEQIGARAFDFDDDDLAFKVYPHQVGASVVAQTDLGLDHDLVAQEQAGNATRDCRSA